MLFERCETKEPSAPRPPKVGRWSRLAIATALILTPVACSADAPEKPAPKPTTTTTLDGKGTPSYIAAQQEATVQLRTSRYIPAMAKGGGGVTSKEAEEYEFNSSWPNCTATHIGKPNEGWFLTAGHCIEGSMDPNKQRYDSVYDMYDSMKDTFTVWSGDPYNGFSKLGNVDSIIADGDYSHTDFALMHVSDMRSFPALQVTTTDEGRGPGPTDYFNVTGYPGAGGDPKLTFPLEYVGRASGQAIADTFGLGDSQRPLYVFGVPYGVDDYSQACTPGMSGSSVMDHDAKEVWGDLSRYSVLDDSTWTELSGAGYDIGKFGTLCIFQPVNRAEVERREALVGVGPAPDSDVVYK